MSCNNATVSNRQLTGRILTLWLTNPLGVTKEHIERLNRTYKFHTRAACGFNSVNGAIALTTLFVTYYNFLRPHISLNYSVPIPLEPLKGITTLQGKWAKIIKLATLA